jgi:hypothetical protein
MKRILLLVFSCLFLFQSKAQIYANDSISPWIIGIGIGFYMAGDDPSVYYSGADNNRFANVFINQTQQRDQVVNSFNGDDFSIARLPTDFVYRNVASFQLSIAYQLNTNWSVDMHFHNVRLTSTGVFTLNVNRVIAGSPEPFLEIGEIRGEETRSHIVLGGGYSYDLEQNWYLKGELGLDLNFIEVIENIASVNGRSYNIQFSQQNLNTSGNNTLSTGIYTSATIGYHIPSKLGIAFRLNYFNTGINLNDVVDEPSGIFVPVFAFTKGF